MNPADSTLIRERLRRLVESHEDETLPLARAALFIAQEEQPSLDRCAYERKIANMAQVVRKRLDGSSDGERRLAAINSLLFEEEGFRGNRDGYYDPRNSYLSDVLDRKLGIPISLSIIYLELCWRVGVAAVGVGLPGHFLVLVDIGERVYVDPFDRGARLDVNACAAKFRMIHGEAAVFHPTMLAPVGPRQILFRVLANLKNIYLRKSDYARAQAAIDRMLLLNPGAVTEYRDRAIANQEIGFFGQACADFQTYLAEAPHSPDSDRVRKAFELAIARRAWSN